MVFCDYANEGSTQGLCDPNMEENTDELNHRQQILDTSTCCMTGNITGRQIINTPLI